jgi:predicted metalloprotease with PDZ domain
MKTRPDNPAGDVTAADVSRSALSYTVSIHPAKHELTIELRLTGPLAVGDVQVELPTWAPGAYAFLPFARDLFNLSASDAASGASLAVTRKGWQGWKISGGTGNLVLTYTVYAYALEYAELCGLLESDYGILMGTRYLRPPDWKGACSVTYNLPEGWAIHHPAGATRVEGTNTWNYPSYLTLLDSPVVIGCFARIVRKVRGTAFYLVFLDRALGFESEIDRFADEVAEIAGEFAEVFGKFPFEHYTFVLSCSPNSHWGLEHATSSVCGVGPEVFVDPAKTGFALRLLAHELFHSWNVCGLKPAPLGKPDLHEGSYTEGLWVGEGVTRYYEFLALTRTGIYTAEQFFSSMVNFYRQASAVPAFSRVTAIDSSLATFVNHRRYAGRCNNSIDYYDKGMVIAFDIDAELRLHDDSLDRAFAAFYDRYIGVDAGYTTDDIVTFLDQRSAGLGELVRREITTAPDLSIKDQLTRLGFRVDMETIPYLGLLFRESIGQTIADVPDDSPAGASGIAPGDVINTVKGYPFSAAGLKWAVKQNEPVRIEVLRGHRTLSFEITPGSRIRIASLTWNGADAQAERIRLWLKRQDFRPQPGQKISLEFYENFHGIEILV